MDLVDKQDRLFPNIPMLFFALAMTSSMSFFPAEVAFICKNSALVELAITLRKRCLSGSRRSIEDDGAELIRLDRTVQ